MVCTVKILYDFVDNASVVKCPCFNYMNNETFEKYYLWVVLFCFDTTPSAVLIQMWYCHDTISCNSQSLIDWDYLDD